MNVKAANVGGKVGFQTECWRVGVACCSSTPTRTGPGVAIDCSLAGASIGSVEELTCPPSTGCFAIRGSRSRLLATRRESPSAEHSACPSVDRVAVEVELREANGLFLRSSACAVSPRASASSTCVGTICLCWNRMAKCAPYTEPLARESFRRISLTSASGGHGCPLSGPIRSTWYSTRSPY